MLVTGCSMFIGASDGVMQVIEYRGSRIQNRCFDGNYCTVKL
ncbi:MAG: hypothetical protein QNJ58_17300 [Desulfobacterales bacterium]|nr:hypothetical protein [Desulfobacterales bacterium]